VLQSLGDTGLPRPIVVDAVRRYLKALRSKTTIPHIDAVITDIRSNLRSLRASRLVPVINGTGILVHTNLGRAPLGPDAVRALSTIGANYNTLEYSLAAGTRGGRATYLEHGVAILCGAEAAAVVNNNAAALVLILDHFVERRRSRSSSRAATAPDRGGFRIRAARGAGARLRSGHDQSDRRC
jgi:L-seryl-tRNA(Ser) seleniumtransferase